MGEIQDDIENKAEEAKDSSADLEAAASTTGDGELEAVRQGGPTEAGRPTHDEADLKEDGGA